MADTTNAPLVSEPDANAAAVVEATRPGMLAGFFTGVAGQLLLYTVGLVLLLVVLVFPLLITERRNEWLAGRVNVAELVAAAAQSSPQHRASNDFSRIARERLFILSIVGDAGAARETVLAPERPVTGTPVRMNFPDDLSLWFPDTLAHFTTSEERHLKLSFKPELTPYEDMEVIVSEATLSLVGFGFPETTATWGTMLVEAASYRALTDFPWLLSPAIAMCLVVLALNLLTDRRELSR